MQTQAKDFKSAEVYRWSWATSGTKNSAYQQTFSLMGIIELDRTKFGLVAGTDGFDYDIIIKE